MVCIYRETFLTVCCRNGVGIVVVNCFRIIPVGARVVYSTSTKWPVMKSLQFSYNAIAFQAFLLEDETWQNWALFVCRWNDDMAEISTDTQIETGWD